MRVATEYEVLRVQHTLWVMIKNNEKKLVAKDKIAELLLLFNLKLKILDENCIEAETLDGKVIFTIKD